MKYEPMEIAWRTGSRHKVDPKVAHDELERVRRDAGGDLTPEAIVLASKRKRAVLHDEFQWDDTIAGHNYRCIQARKIIQNIKVVYAEAPEVQTRAYEVTTRPASTEEKERKVFRSVDEILSDPEARVELLGQAIKDAISFRHRYRGLQELAQVFDSMDEFVQRARI